MDSSTLDARRGFTAPSRTDAQRREALGRANYIRTNRAGLKRDLKAGRASIADVLLEPPVFAETAKVFDLMLAVPKWGRVKVNKALVQTHISPSKTVGGMTQRQRCDLVSAFGFSERARTQRAAAAHRQRLAA